MTRSERRCRYVLYGSIAVIAWSFVIASVYSTGWALAALAATAGGLVFALIRSAGQ